jgi:coenzyme F420 hydrogenase subunit delta
LAEGIGYVPEYCRKGTLILGCGNVLLGDDGFGPQVIAYLQSHYPLSEDVALLDVGTGVQGILLDLALSQQKPRRLVLVDVLDRGQPPGTVSTLRVDSLPRGRGGDFYPHLSPTSSLLRELEELAGVEVVLITVQSPGLPQEVHPGLSAPVQEAVPRACELIARRFFADA